MKKLILFTLISFLPFTVLSQSCLPEGITFTTQEQINNFQTDNPGCTEIEGDVEINGNDITNLIGLNVLTFIGGDLKINYNDNLTSLIGLDNITYIGGRLLFYWNNSLTSLTGLEGLTTIGERLYIAFHDNLSSLTGLDNLTSIGGSLFIDGTYLLNDLNGLNNLSAIGGGLTIGWDWVDGGNSLESLTGLEGLTTIGGGLTISYNPGLVNLSGINNLNAGSIENLSINNNHSLTTCEVQSICDYLSNPGGIVEIYDNAPGCNNPPEIANACGFTLPCLPYGNYYLFTQDEIDNFATNYPGCTALEGSVHINGSDITNLYGLNGLISIAGSLSIGESWFWGTDSLTNLEGLDNLISIGGLTIEANNALTSLSGLDGITSLNGLEIAWNPVLASLSGLENLTSIEGGLNIKDNDALASLSELQGITSIGGHLRIRENDVLTSLSGLDNVTHIGGGFYIDYNNNLTNTTGMGSLTSIGGILYIMSNDMLTSLEGLNSANSIGDALRIFSNNSLTSLSGLDNIDASTIVSLGISGNSSLSTCEVKSVCDYLAAPNGNVYIHDNAPGCNTQEEVEEACDPVSVNEVGILDQLIIHPLPFTTSTTLTYEIQQPENVILTIYDYLGKQVEVIQENQPQGKQQLLWDADRYADGVYYYRLQIGEQTANGKMVKVK